MGQIPDVYGRLFLTVSVLFSLSRGEGHCEKISSCSCRYEDGSIVDLTPLTLGNGSARFSDFRDPILDFFSWNPCIDFTEGDCKDVAVCQIEPSVPHPQFWSLGSQKSALFETNVKGELTLVYSETQHNILRTAYVALICDVTVNGSIEAVGERQEKTTFDFTLRSKHACAVGESSSPSLGTILLIIAGSLVISYFILGVPIQIFVKKESGKNAIPFFRFWNSLPGLVKDGILFTVRRKVQHDYRQV